MRRLRRKKELKFSRIVILFVISITTFSVGYSLLSQNLSVEGTTNLIIQTEDTKEFKSKNLKLTYEDKNWHSGGTTYYQYDFVLTNIGNETIENWQVVIDFPSNVEHVGGWAANYELKNGKLIITGMEYNLKLNPGNQATFGLQLSTTDSEIKIIKVNLNGEISTEENPGKNPGENQEDNPIEEPNKDLAIEIKRNSYWGTKGEYYLQFAITVTNNSDLNINPWKFKLSVPSDANITNYWNFNYIIADGIMTINPTDSNSNLYAGASTSMGFIIKTADLNYVPTVK